MLSKESGSFELSFVQELYTQDTGGGFTRDVFRLDDGPVIVIGEESILLYEELAAWENDPKRQGDSIFRLEDISKS